MDRTANRLYSRSRVGPFALGELCRVGTAALPSVALATPLAEARRQRIAGSSPGLAGGHGDRRMMTTTRRTAAVG